MKPRRVHTSPFLLFFLVGRLFAGCFFMGVVLNGCAGTKPGHFTADAPPVVRVGLLVGVAEATVRFSSGFTIADDQGVAAAIPQGGELRVFRNRAEILIQQNRETLARGQGPFRLTSNNKVTPILVDGKPYPGAVTVGRNTRSGVNIVNRVDLETYLRGVIPKEIPSAGKYQQAARAQAVVARTYALNKLGQFPAEGFDVYAGVLDQVYGPIGARNAAADEAVMATRGQLLLYKGRPIEAKYASTCGGKRAAMDESFYLKVPYLRSGEDKLNGKAACRHSKYYRWEETWTGDALWTILAKSVPNVSGKSFQGTVLKEIKVTKRGGSGRAVSLRIKTDAAQYRFTKGEIRNVLRRPDGGMLRSTAIKIKVDKRRGRITRLNIKGQGWGHGVGMCQWGAMEFSASGKDYAAILHHYYPKTQLERVY